MSRRGGAFHAFRKRLRRRWKHKPGVLPWLMALPPRCMLFLLRLLPPSFSLWVAERIGRLAWRIPGRRRAGRLHLAQAFPALAQEDRDHIGRVSCGQMARGILETIVLGPRATPARALEHVDFDPGVREFLEGRVGRGAVVVQGHFGSMEGLDAILGVLGLRIMTPMRFPTNYYLGQDILAARSGWGVDLVPRKGALRRMLTRLKEGGSVVVPMDQNAHHAPIFVPWFGMSAATDRAAAYLAMRTGLPLVVCWCIRETQRSRFRVGMTKVRPERAPEEVGDRQILEITRAVHQALEAAIRAHPEQYLWIHDRYRTRPPQQAVQPAAAPLTAESRA